MKEETSSPVSDVILEQGGEVGANVNVSKGVLRLRVLLLAIPHALSDVKSFAVSRNMLAHFQPEGFSDPKPSSRKKGKQNSIATFCHRNDLLGFPARKCGFALLPFVHNRKPDVLEAPVTRMKLLTFFVNRRCDDGLHHLKIGDDCLVGQWRFCSLHCCNQFSRRLRCCES